MAYGQDGSAIDDYGIITEQPEGELRVYERSGNAVSYDEETGKLVTQAQTGILSIVFAADGTVYMQNPVSGISGYLYKGCWVKGRTSSDGTTITIPLKQYIDYIKSFDIASEMCLYRYDRKQNKYLPDMTTTEVTYTVGSDGVVKLDGTSADCILSATYRSPGGHEVGSQVDGLWVDTGDYESVYTPSDDQPATPPANVETEELYFMATANDGMDWMDFSQKAVLAHDGDEVYLQGFCKYLPKAWIKGRREDGKLKFATNQFIGNYNNEALYFMGGQDAANNSFVIKDVEFTYNGKDMYTTTDYFIINGKKDQLYVYLYYYGATLSYHDNETVTAPEDLETETYTLTYKTYDTDGQLVDASSFVNIGFKDGEVYMQRIWEVLPDAWVKGRSENGKVVFDAPQFLGYYEQHNEKLPAYFIPFNMENGDLLESITFDYDSDAGTLDAGGQAIGICLNTARMLSYIEIRDPQMTMIPDVAIVPADPSITEYAGEENVLPYIIVRVPGEGANGETLDLNKLSYQLLSDVEGVVQPIVLTTDLYERVPYDMETIPWLYADNYDVVALANDSYKVFLNAPVSEYNRIGVQSIYTTKTQTLRSATAWEEIKDYTTDIESVGHSTLDNNHTVYDLQGRIIANGRLPKGLYIVGGKKVIR